VDAFKNDSVFAVRLNDDGEALGKCPILEAAKSKLWGFEGLSGDGRAAMCLWQGSSGLFDELRKM